MSGREGMKLGKTKPRPNYRTLLLSNYLGEELPAPPAKTYWEYKVKSYPMMLNDQLGDCVFACGGHLVQEFTAHTGTEVIPTDAQVLAAYEAVSGYVPGNSNTDNGAAITDFLAYWLNQGFAGQPNLLGWAAIDQTDITSVKQAVFLFGALDIGMNLPNSAMDQFQAGQPWDVVADDGGIDGGHCIPIMGYGADGFTIVTWGKTQQMTNAFFQKYCDEGYALISPQWMSDVTKLAPNGLDLAALQADLAALKA
jgi:hypothetical protein